MKLTWKQWNARTWLAHDGTQWLARVDKHDNGHSLWVAMEAGADWTRIGCEDWHAVGMFPSLAGAKQKAAEHWNRRIEKGCFVIA